MLTAAMLYEPARAYTNSRPATMSELNAPTHGAGPPQLSTFVIFENT